MINKEDIVHICDIDGIAYKPNAQHVLGLNGSGIPHFQYNP